MRASRHRVVRLGLLCAAVLVAAVHANAADWPTYQHDNRRSAATSEKLGVALEEAWVYESDGPPQTAWAGPAPWDSYARKVPLKPMRRFDPAFFVTVVGERVFFGSSVDDSVHCLDAASGAELWAYLTEGPVRLPPSCYNGKLYFGSDDGHAYCLKAIDGSLVWEYRATAENRQIPSNGKLISPWPVRTGVVVQDGKACFAASLLPWRESYVCALDAQTGSDQGEGCYRAEHRGMTMQGALLASASGLYVPQGRLAPVAFKLSDGTLLGKFGKDQQGGVYALLTSEEGLVHGSGIFEGGLHSDAIGSFAGGNHLIVTPDRSYFHTDTHLIALDRTRFLPLATRRTKLSARQAEIQERLKALGKKGKKEARDALDGELGQVQRELQQVAKEIQACYLWQKPCDCPYALILAADVLFAGGQDKVAALDRTSGNVLWTGKVTGMAFGLAAANGRLLVSTERGTIHCFAASTD